MWTEDDNVKQGIRMVLFATLASLKTDIRFCETTMDGA